MANSCVIHFGMMNDIKIILKKNNLSTNIHLVGGCSCSGIYIDYQSQTEKELILFHIQTYLKDKFMYIVEDEKDEHVFHPLSILK